MACHGWGKRRVRRFIFGGDIVRGTGIGFLALFWGRMGEEKKVEHNGQVRKIAAQFPATGCWPAVAGRIRLGEKE